MKRKITKTDLIIARRFRAFAYGVIVLLAISLFFS